MPNFRKTNKKHFHIFRFYLQARGKGRQQQQQASEIIKQKELLKPQNNNNNEKTFIVWHSDLLLMILILPASLQLVCVLKKIAKLRGRRNDWIKFIVIVDERETEEKKENCAENYTIMIVIKLNCELNDDDERDPEKTESKRSRKHFFYRRNEYLECDKIWLQQQEDLKVFSFFYAILWLKLWQFVARSNFRVFSIR